MACEVRLMGGFGVQVDGMPISARGWRHRRAAELVKLLALSDAHRLHREQLMDALWPDLPVEAAAANLRKAVHYARRALGSPASIVTGAEMVELWPGGQVSVDVAVFEEAVRAALVREDRTAAETAAALYTGELLPEDRFALWAEQPRERHRMLAMRVLKAAAQWERVLAIDPADEEAHRALMEHALLAGNRTAAIRQFERLRERLRTDLGMGPGRAAVALYERALAQEASESATALERVRVLLAWGLVHLNSGDLDVAEQTAEQARALALEAGLGREIGEASALLGILANMRGRWKNLFRGEFAASVRRSPEVAAFVFDAHLCLAEFCLFGPGGHEDIVGYARELLAVAEESGSLQGRAFAKLLLGEADLFSGRMVSAEEHLKASVIMHEKAGAHSGHVIAVQRLAESAIAQGRLSHARRLLRPSLRLAEASPLAPHLVVRMHGTLVQAAEGNALGRTVDAADVALADQVTCPPCSMGFRAAAVTALARCGRIQQAQRRLDEVERLAGMWPGGPWHAAVWEARGVIRRAQGDGERASAFLREAADRYAAVGRPLDEARCRAAS